MKRFLTTVLLAASACLSICGQEKFCIGTDIASAICLGQLKITAGYNIYGRWTADTAISVNIKRLLHGADETETAHWNELYENRSLNYRNGFKDTLTESGISFSFWPKAAFDGLCISFGASIRDRDGTDMTAGIGYCCTIWKSISAKMLYNTRIMESIKNEKMSYKGIGIEIRYAF